MAYKLLDSNGNYMNINGMHKGTIVSPYKYHGMELYNENTIATNRYAFYSSYRRVYTGSGYVYPTGSTHYYTTTPYESTSIIINGRYSSSSYKNYEVYKDGNLVASGSFTSSTTNIYTCEKNANTSIIVSGMWDSTNSKFIYNITTNATIERSNSYNWNNGIVTTSTLTKNGTVAKYGTSNTVGITTPTQEEIYGMLPSDCVIMSATYSTVFSAANYSSTDNIKITFYFRTDYDNSTSIIKTLPGSSLGTISNLGYNQSGSFTRTGTSYLGKTYYIYYHASNWSSGQYRSLTSLNYQSVSSTTTATVKYRYFDEVHTAIINVTRTNAYTLPKYTFADIQSLLSTGYGSINITNFTYHWKLKNNATSGSYTYYRIRENTTVVYGPYSLTLNSTTVGSRQYTSDMTYALTLQRSNASDGTYSNGSDTYISFPNEDEVHYLTVTYTWTPS